MNKLFVFLSLFNLLIACDLSAGKIDQVLDESGYFKAVFSKEMPDIVQSKDIIVTTRRFIDSGHKITSLEEGTFSGLIPLKITFKIKKIQKVLLLVKVSCVDGCGVTGEFLELAGKYTFDPDRNVSSLMQKITLDYPVSTIHYIIWVKTIGNKYYRNSTALTYIANVD